MAHRSSSRERLRALLTATATAAVVLALLGGMPYVLWQATGVPWPDRIGSWRELGDHLTQPITDPAMVELFAMAGWVCWAAFALSLLAEAAWYGAHLPQLLRDRTAHTAHLQTLPVQRALAAVCIGTLALALISLCRPATAHAHQHAPTNALRSHIAATAPAHPGPAHDNHCPAQKAEEPTAPRCVEYTVAEGDTLWTIAKAHLGDPLKWPRIYALNKTRIQADGTRLTDPDLITPGWQLTIPVTSSASTPRHATPATPSAAPGERSAPRAQADPPPQEPARVGSAEREVGRRATGDHTTSHARPGPAAISVGAAGVIGITTAAGLLAALRFYRFYQNRSRRPNLDTQLPPLSPVVEKAVVAAREATLARATTEAAGPDRLIQRRTPPQRPQPPSSVTIGTENAAEVPLNVLAASGGCAWTGPGAEATARALLIGILTAAERLRPAAPHVAGLLTQDLADRLLPGMPPDFSALTLAPDLGHALHRAEEHLLAHAHHRQNTQESVHAPRLATGQGTAENSGPATLVLLAEPDTPHIEHLTALANRATPHALIVLTLGDLPGAASWHIAPDGAVTQEQNRCGSTQVMHLFHLTPEAGRDVLDVLLTAHDTRLQLRVVPSARAAADPPQDVAEDADQEPEDEAPVAASEPAESSTPCRSRQATPVRLNVLGPTTLYTAGNLEPIGSGLRDEVREFLALLAAHPRGLLADDIAHHLRLDADPEQSAKDLKNLRRAVRRALRAATGHSKAEFIQRHGELHKLHSGLVETDLAAFTHSLQQAAAATDEAKRMSALHRAVDLYDGPFAHGGDYPWCDSLRESLAGKATDAVAHIAHHAEHTGAQHDADTALALLEKIITLHPTHELLYQHAIRLHQTAGRHDTARQTFALLTRHLNELGLEPDPATRALVTSSTRGSVHRS
ncbi:BTAD domain-containing putative transcriptional regulator [Streptomyces sp. NPDC021218]|uniref:BTAD domain-containing putative transcriptional regulator n=1 Tax=Streptomyces sp. NPDC021218 TaxID=3365119 RepID=UPI0037890BFB